MSAEVLLSGHALACTSPCDVGSVEPIASIALLAGHHEGTVLIFQVLKLSGSKPAVELVYGNDADWAGWAGSDSCL